MKRAFLIMTCMSAMIPALAQRPQWMKSLPDSTPVNEMAIAGAHDAATGHGFAGVAGVFAGPFAKTQSAKIPELWNLGIRAYDFRPGMHGGELRIYHGPIRTKLSLSSALGMIADKLKDNPSEMAVIIMRMEKPSEDWGPEVARAISESGLEVTGFRENLTLGESRGKALIISRDSVPHPDVALITGWRHDTIAAARIGRTEIGVQDVYDCTAPGRAGFKEKIMIALARQTGWRINHLSGFTRKHSAANNRHFSRRMLRVLLDSVEAPSGIIMLDFPEP